MAIPEPQPIYLVQDNSPIHKSKLVDQWFQHHPQFVRLFWPAKSPDLNPIENVWSKMVQKWKHDNERTENALECHCQLVWESLRQEPEYVESLVRSVPRRIEEVRDAQGGYTRY